MNQIKAYKVLWWVIPLIAIPIALGSDSTFDIQVHDTYFVFASIQVVILFSTFLGLLGGIYWLLREYRLIRILSLIHSIVTSIAIIGIAVVVICQSFYSEKGFEFFRQLNSIGAILIGILIVIQLIFIINIIIGVIRGKKRKTS